MKTVILCGGLGTRIRDVAEDIPKPMIPVGQYPILWHIMKHYARWGYEDFILCLGYKSEVIKDFFLNYQTRVSDLTVSLGQDNGVTIHEAHQDENWSVTLAETGLNTLTGSRISKIRKYIGTDEHFMLTYGDGLSDVNLNALVDFHKKHGKIMTISGVRPPGRFGEIDHDGDGTILQFNEKPQATGGRISGGFMVCSRKIFDYLDPSKDDETLEAEPMRAITEDGQMAMFSHDGFWQCMDTFRDYKLLKSLLESGDAPWTK